jgi:hypothetical protein
MEEAFRKVYVRKPQASRDRSREVYLVAKGLKAEVSLQFTVCRQRETCDWHETRWYPAKGIES